MELWIVKTERMKVYVATNVYAIKAATIARISVKTHRTVADVIVPAVCISTNGIIRCAKKIILANNGERVLKNAKTFRDVGTSVIATMITFWNPTDLLVNPKIHRKHWSCLVLVMNYDPLTQGPES